MVIDRFQGFYITNCDLSLFGIKIERGFISDGASIPKLLKPLFQREEYKYLIPAILHDWMYANQMGYFKSNLYFYEAMKIYKVNRLTRILFWLTVTLFGWIFYYKILYLRF